jgi:hypothetical protein
MAMASLYNNENYQDIFLLKNVQVFFLKISREKKIF